MPELKPCPFCGATQESGMIAVCIIPIDSFLKRETIDAFGVQCSCCGATMGHFTFPTEKDAQKAWNRRTETTIGTGAANDLISRSHFDERVRLAGGSCEGEVSADFLDGVLSVLELLKTEPPAAATGWICVEKHKPEIDVDVLCFLRSGSIEVLSLSWAGTWDGTCGKFWRPGYVTHWMPLPKPPEEV